MTRVERLDGIEKETLFDPYQPYSKKIKSHHFVLYGTTGHGKSVTSEVIVEKLHDRDFLIIAPTEKFKHRLEYAFCQFLPKSRLHLKYLAEQGKPLKKKNAIIHSLFVNNAKYVNKTNPFNHYWKKKLPPMNMFTFDIKNDVDVNHWRIIFDNERVTESIQAVLTCQRDLNENEGVLDLMNMCEERIKNGSIKGTQQNINEINDVLKRLFNLGFVSPSNCSYNLDADKILLDQDNYHLFFYGFLPGESFRKEEYFSVSIIQQKLLKRYEELNKSIKTSGKLRPLVFVIQEVNAYLPDYTKKAYVRVASELFEENLKQVRSLNVSTVADAQNVYRTAEGYRETASEHSYYGRLANVDIERLGKTTGYPKSIRERLANLPKNHYMKKGERRERVFLFPSHRHCEEGEDYFIIYSKEYPENLKQHSDVFDYMNNLWKMQDEKYKNYLKEKARKKKDKSLKKQIKEIEKLEKSHEEKESLKKELKETKETSLNKMKIEIYLRSKLNPNVDKAMSWLKLGKEFEIADKTAKSYAIEGKTLYSS